MAFHWNSTSSDVSVALLAGDFSVTGWFALQFAALSTVILRLSEETVQLAKTASTRSVLSPAGSFALALLSEVRAMSASGPPLYESHRR